MTSSMLDGSIPERSTTALIGTAARSSARTPANAPPCLPTGVRSAAQMKASRVTFPVSRFPFPGFSQPHPHGLRLRIIVQRLAPQVAPEPGELVAAERSRGIVEVVRVPPDRPSLDRARHAVRLRDVSGPDPRREAVQRAVGELDALGLVVERQHRQHRTEDFLVDDLHPGPGVVEHRGFDVEAFAVHLRGLAARHQPGAFLLSRRDVGEHGLLLTFGDDGTEPRALVERVAGGELFGPLGELCYYLIVDRALHQQPRARGADLALAVEDAVLGAAHGG